MSTYDERLQTETATSGEGIKERAVDTVAEVDAGAMHVAGVAGEEAKSVAREAKSAARGFLDETKTQLTDQAATQQRRAADALRSAGDELSQMASSASGGGMATGLVRGLGRRSSEAATWLQDREPADLVREVRGFARRHTGVFLIAALGVGIVAGRLTRALASGASGTGAGGSPGQRPNALDAAGYGGYASPGGTTGAAYAGGAAGTTATGGAYTGAASASSAEGDTPIGDALAADPLAPAAPATGDQFGGHDVGVQSGDEWSPGGEEQR